MGSPMQNIENLISAARAAAARGQIHEALSLSKQATSQFPLEADAWVLSAMLNRQMGQLRAARQDFESACALRPDDPHLIHELFTLLEQLDAYEDAGNLLDEAIERLPRNNDLLMSRAGLSSRLGDLETSTELVLKVFQRTPDHSNAIYTLVMQGHGDKVGGLDGIKTHLSRTVSGSIEHNYLSYAYAFLLEQDKRYDEAFVAYARANAQQASAGGMDVAAKQKGAAAVIKDMSAEIIERFSGRGNDSDRPVFIVGMPRSGTTLTEQVLAAHPDVYAAGEQGFLSQVLQGLISRTPPSAESMIESINHLAVDVWNQAGAEYLRRIGELNDQSKRVTDKMPVNFALLPYIRLIFPRACIIHLRREPLASIASCIRTRFSNPILALSVEDWARFYGMYQGMMDHWRPILGKQLLELDYEELVRDLPAQSRRLTDFLGLEWHKDCLHPERNKLAIHTASFRQVRQGVHTGAIEAWRCYETQLEALRPVIAESRSQLVLPDID